MSATEQFLTLVVAPGAIVAVIWALASLGGPRAKKRYRPGRTYEFAPVWYVANLPAGGATDAQATAQPPEASPGEAPEAPEGDASARGTTGGASDRW